VNDEVAAGVLGAVLDLPDTIEMISLRTLGWPMGQLVHAGARLNLLSLEALTTARHLSAELCLTEVDDNIPLQAAAENCAVNVRIISD